MSWGRDRTKKRGNGAGVGDRSKEEGKSRALPFSSRDIDASGRNKCSVGADWLGHGLGVSACSQKALRLLTCATPTKPHVQRYA